MRVFIVSFYLFLLSVSGISQVLNIDSIYSLKEVSVESSRLQEFAVGNTVSTIDSLQISRYQGQSIADLLSQNSGIFIKSYGAGSLATVSFRGSGASHTAVLWNGFNIQGPTLGQVDFSTVPAGFLDQVAVQHGGAGALFGSGAVGGVIHLNNSIAYDKGKSSVVNIQSGSFSNYQGVGKFEISKKRFVSSTRVLGGTAKNDFPFVNTALYGSPEMKMQNAGYTQKALLHENFFKINDAQQINLRIWLQDYDRQIPPSMLMNQSAAKLGGRSYRVSSEWKKAGNKSVYALRSAYFNEQLNYFDEQSDISSDVTFQTSISEGEIKSGIGKNQLLNLGFNNTYNMAQSDGFTATHYQNRMALFASYKLQSTNEKWKTVASLRQEFIDTKRIPFTPSVGFEGRLFKNLVLHGNIARIYRVPTFNDLYWNFNGDKGNIDLKPENGWSEEIGLSYISKFSKSELSLSASVFNSNIDQWIIWLPQGGFWSPENIQSVWARGIENSLNLKFEIYNINMVFNAGYNHVLSTNVKAKRPNDESLNKQLIYVPLDNAFSNITISYKGFSLNYNQTYTGLRYVSTDNSDYMQGYYLGNLSFSKDLTVHKSKFSLLFKINNIWNTPYQVMLWRPMPLSNYQVGLSWRFGAVH